MSQRLLVEIKNDSDEVFAAIYYRWGGFASVIAEHTYDLINEMTRHLPLRHNVRFDELWFYQVVSNMVYDAPDSSTRFLGDHLKTSIHFRGDLDDGLLLLTGEDIHHYRDIAHYVSAITVHKNDTFTADLAGMQVVDGNELKRLQKEVGAYHEVIYFDASAPKLEDLFLGQLKDVMYYLLVANEKEVDVIQFKHDQFLLLDN